MYNKNYLKVNEFDIPIISIGNLTVGGTGKTPHAEYIIRLLRKRKIATLSRGYGRTSKGFLIADSQSTVSTIGDEPSQIHGKFGDVLVAVCEQRVEGIQKIMSLNPETQVIILDDAFQHRAVKAGLSLLLMNYNDLFDTNFLLPSGTLREPMSSAKRADVIVVTKTPSIFSPMEMRRVEERMRAEEHQKVFYSTIDYGEFVPLYKQGQRMPFSKEFYFERGYTFVLLTGIANTSPLRVYIEEKGCKVVHAKHPDHHRFNTSDIQKLKTIFNNIVSQNKIIVTTEKDATRLMASELRDLLSDMPVYYLPITIRFHGVGATEFDKLIKQYAEADKRNS